MNYDFEAFVFALLLFLVFSILLISYKRWISKSSSLLFPDIYTFGHINGSWKLFLEKCLLPIRILSIFFLLFAFIRLQEGRTITKISKEGVAIQMLIDKSSSMREKMQYEGASMTRLEVVKKVFTEFILGNDGDLSGRGTDLIGLSSFAGYVEENAPLTLDHENFPDFVDSINIASKLEDGTIIGDALYHTSLKLIGADIIFNQIKKQNQDYQIKSKIIILLTDGQQTQGGYSAIKAAEFARDNQVKVYTIAIVNEDSVQNASSILSNFFSMRSPLDTSLLEKIAQITGGQFSKATSGESLKKIYEKIDELETSEFEVHITLFNEKYQIYLLIGIVLLFLEIFLNQLIVPKFP